MASLAFPIMGTIPQWIAAFSSTGIFGVAIAVGTIWLKSRKVGIEERRNDRQGWGDMIDRLNGDVDKLKRINVKLYSKMIKCDAGFAAMKLRVGELHFVLRLQNQELERVSHDSPVLAHARELLAAVYPVDEIEPPDDELDALAEDLP